MNIRPQEIQIADYDYPLPDERIAKYPLADRSSSKLLRYQAGEIEEFTFRDLPRLLPEGAVLVRNNSKVIRARLLFHKDSGARIEIFCLDPAAPTSYELSLGERHHCSWHCLIGNAKRFKEDFYIRLAEFIADNPQLSYKDYWDADGRPYEKQWPEYRAAVKMAKSIRGRE